MIGTKFGKWEVLTTAPPRNKTKYYLCQCECGHQQEVREYHLRKGNSTSCVACGRLASRGASSPHWRGGSFISSSKLNRCRKGAESRGLEFSIDIPYLEQVWDEQQGKCAYTGIQLEWHHTRDKQHDLEPSLDRIDNSLGYIVGNVQWVHKKVNQMKSDLTEEDFLRICVLVSSYRKGNK